MAKARRLSKDYSTLQEFTDAGPLAKKVQSLLVALDRRFPVHETGKTEASRDANTPVSIPGNRMLFYPKGQLAKRAKLERALKQVRTMIPELAMSVYEVKPKPHACNPSAQKPKNGRKRRKSRKKK